MTRVGFYVVQSAGAGERLQVAVRLADKAFGQGHRIFINAADQAQARALDKLLWSYRPASFIPHGLYGSGDDADVAIGWGQEPVHHDDLLINLQLEPPAFFSRFARVAEVVTQDPDSIEALRNAWRLYREKGYHLEKYNL